MKPAAFEYCRPESLKETLALLSELGDDAAVLAGGMSLGPMLNLRLARPRAVVDITRLGELEGVEVRDGTVVTRAGLRQADAMGERVLTEAVPLLAKALPWVGHVQTRSRGTLAGSVAHADPSAEIPLCLATLDGSVVLRGRRRERRLRAREFFLGVMTTARSPGELIVALQWPKRRPGEGFGFAEVAERHGDFAIAACACRLRVEHGRITALDVGLGGIEDRPVVPDAGECIGEPPEEALTEEFAKRIAAGLHPMSDHAATPAFRRALARRLVRDTVAEALAQAREAP